MFVPGLFVADPYLYLVLLRVSYHFVIAKYFQWLQKKPWTRFPYLLTPPEAWVFKVSSFSLQSSPKLFEYVTFLTPRFSMTILQRVQGFALRSVDLSFPPKRKLQTCKRPRDLIVETTAISAWQVWHLCLTYSRLHFLLPESELQQTESNLPPLKAAAMWVDFSSTAVY